MLLFVTSFCGGTKAQPYPFDQAVGCFPSQNISSDDPRPIGKRMICWYLTTVDGQAQSSRTDFQQSCGFGEVQPCTCVYLAIAGDADRKSVV